MTNIVDRVRALADEVEKALYAENDRGGEARQVLHQLYLDLVDLTADEDPISGWELPLLEARSAAIRERVKRGDEAWRELYQVYQSTLTFEEMLDNEDPSTAEGLASGVRARLADLETERDEVRTWNSDLVEKLRQRDAEHAQEVSGLRSEIAALRRVPVVPKDSVALSKSEVDYRNRVFAACRDLAAELPPGSYSEEGAAQFALVEIRRLAGRFAEERQAKEAALRQLDESTRRERDLEAQLQRLSSGKPESNGKADDLKDPVEELLREGVDGFLRMLGKLG